MVVAKWKKNTLLAPCLNTLFNQLKLKLVQALTSGGTQEGGSQEWVHPHTAPTPPLRPVTLGPAPQRGEPREPSQN